MTYKTVVLIYWHLCLLLLLGKMSPWDVLQRRMRALVSREPGSSDVGSIWTRQGLSYSDLSHSYSIDSTDITCHPLWSEWEGNNIQVTVDGLKEERCFVPLSLVYKEPLSLLQKHQQDCKQSTWFYEVIVLKHWLDHGACHYLEERMSSYLEKCEHVCAYCR